MNFTREPIIETIITPKEGHKLLVRSSKGKSGEEYIVDAVEVVSFGNALFFRSQERPKSFLIPVSDFEVLETKETRVVLKNASFERSIKIGGGKEASLKIKKEEEPAEEASQKLEKKRERKRHRRKRTSTQPEEGPTKQAEATEGGGEKDETAVSSSVVSKLIPPPKGLISDKFPPKENTEIAEKAEGDVLPEPVAEEKPKKKRAPRKKAKPEAKEEESSKDKEISKEELPKNEEDSEKKPSKEKEESPKDEETPSAEGGDVQKISTEPQEVVTSTSFSSIEGQGEPFGKTW